MKTITKIEAAEPSVRREERVAAYCRVSTAMTEQKESLQAQREHFEQVIAQRRDWMFAGIYSDEGISGTKKETRPALQRLLQDCENGLVDRIVTKSLSRFARNTADCLEMVRHLLDLGIPIYFEKEHLDTGRMENEFLLTLLGGLAEDESRSMSKNIKWSIQRRMENGTYRSVTPYGYRQDEDGWHIVEEEARWVRYMFEQAANGVNFQAIAESLNAQGVKVPRTKPWTKDTLLYLLKNEKYIGDCRLQKSYMDSDFHRCVNRGEEAQYYVEEHHEPIVSRETFQAVQRVIALRSTRRKAGKVGYIPQKTYPFTGKIVCGLCGARFKRRIHSEGEQSYAAWTCPTHLKDKEACTMKFLREDRIEQAFTTMMNKLIFAHEAVLGTLLRSLRSETYSETLERIQALDERLQKNLEARDNLQTIRAKGYLADDLYRENEAALREESAAMDEERRALAVRVSTDIRRAESVQTLLRFARNSTMRKTFDAAAFDRFVDHIVAEDRGHLIFHLKCGLRLREEVH